MHIGYVGYATPQQWSTGRYRIVNSLSNGPPIARCQPSADMTLALNNSEAKVV
jgi:hypothetical protein